MEMGYDPPETFKSEDGADRFGIHSSILLDNGRYNVIISGNERKRFVMFCITSPTVVPRKKRLAVAEFITRVNYGLINGNLEMDFSDGEVGYKISLSVTKSPVTTNLLHSPFMIGLINMDTYQSFLESVVIGECTPEEANEASRKEEQPEAAKS